MKEIEALKIDTKPVQQSEEDAAERKKRLLEQRELIRNKKMAERKEELNAYVQNVKNPFNLETRAHSDPSRAAKGVRGGTGEKT